MQKKTFTNWVNAYLAKVSTACVCACVVFFSNSVAPFPAFKRAQYTSGDFKITSVSFFKAVPPDYVRDLFVDIRDGVKLVRLLEVLSGVRLVSLITRFFYFTAETIG